MSSGPRKTPDRPASESNTDRDERRAVANDEAMPDEGQAAEPNPAGTDVHPPALDPAGLVTRLDELEAEIASLRDERLRALAEVENVRRRAQRDREDALKFGASALARDLLSVADNLRRAVASIPADVRAENSAFEGVAQGVEMVERELLGAFEKHRILKVEPAPGEKFDVNLHQAMFEVETTEQPPGTVVQVLQAGYTIADRLLRPAMVGVAKAPAAAQAKA